LQNCLPRQDECSNKTIPDPILRENTKSILRRNQYKEKLILLVFLQLAKKEQQPQGRKLRCSESSKQAHSTRQIALDRKSTRLNSSHVSISYAVFCLKKKRANE